MAGPRPRPPKPAPAPRRARTTQVPTSVLTELPTEAPPELPTCDTPSMRDAPGNRMSEAVPVTGTASGNPSTAPHGTPRHPTTHGSAVPSTVISSLWPRGTGRSTPSRAPHCVRAAKPLLECLLRLVRALRRAPIEGGSSGLMPSAVSRSRHPRAGLRARWMREQPSNEGRGV